MNPSGTLEEREELYPRWDSNPHWIDFKSTVSAIGLRGRAVKMHLLSLLDPPAPGRDGYEGLQRSDGLQPCERLRVAERSGRNLAATKRQRHKIVSPLRVGRLDPELGGRPVTESRVVGRVAKKHDH